MTDDSKALEAAIEGVMAEMPTDRGTTFEQAAQLYAQAAVRAYLAQREADGFVMVPVEATEGMLTRGKRQPNDLREIYRAMIAARPIVER